MKLLVILALVATILCSIDAALARRKQKKNGVPTQMCLSGDGTSYNGFVSTSAHGRRCLPWRKFRRPMSDELKSHNYCRNPDQSLMPWCRVRRGSQYVREFCDIPKCQNGTASTPTEKPPTPIVDTELTCGETTKKRQYKIVRGLVSPIESQPWMAAIFYRGKFLCGGSLIAPCWVLTAAHCFEGLSKRTVVRNLAVHLGKSASNETQADKEQHFSVEQMIRHSSYNDDTYNNDIALLQITNADGGCAVRTDTVRTVCLPPAYTMLPPGAECDVAGYGKESALSDFSKVLKKTTVQLLTQSKCKTKDYYGNRVTKNMFCAASPDWSTDACKGDSGGPLVYQVAGREFLFGIVSWGEGCAKRNKPGVYTQVSNYNSWISKMTGLPAIAAGAMYPTK